MLGKMLKLRVLRISLLKKNATILNLLKIKELKISDLESKSTNLINSKLLLTKYIHRKDQAKSKFIICKCYSINLRKGIAFTFLGVSLTISTFTMSLANNNSP